MPGVLSLVAEGYVDRAKIGVQGHSWGGYQIAYMVTRTDLFTVGCDVEMTDSMAYADIVLPAASWLPRWVPRW